MRNVFTLGILSTIAACSTIQAGIQQEYRGLKSEIARLTTPGQSFTKETRND